MQFLRYIFLISIIGGSTSVGFLLSKEYYDRVSELNIFSKTINILKNKIKFTQKPLNEIFQELSQIEINSNISKIFYKTSHKLKKYGMNEAWMQAISEEKNFLNLKIEDVELIETLGNVLGKSDVDGQISEINQFLSLLDLQIKKAEEEKNKNAKMCKSLCTIIGAVIVIILF